MDDDKRNFPIMPELTDSEKMGRRIKAARVGCGLTQNDLARKLNVTKATVSKLETGYTPSISRKRISELADILGVTPGYLLGWEYLPLEMQDQLLAHMRFTKDASAFAAAIDAWGAPQNDEHTHVSFSSVNEAKTFLEDAASMAIDDPNLLELTNIYKHLSIRSRNKLLSFAYELDDEEKKCEQ